MSITEFQNDYLATWIEPDLATRRNTIERIWAPNGRLVISSLGLTVEGVEDIAAHTSRVHDDLIAGKGLTFAYDHAVENGDALLLRWSILTPGGDVAGRGVDVVFRDAPGRAATVYMFMGIN